MLAHSNMPNSFLPYAIKMATYLRNRLPSSALHHGIPYECWFETLLQCKDLKILKPFGCIVWDQIPQQDRKWQRSTSSQIKEHEAAVSGTSRQARTSIGTSNVKKLSTHTISPSMKWNSCNDLISKNLTTLLSLFPSYGHRQQVEMMMIPMKAQKNKILLWLPAHHTLASFTMKSSSKDPHTVLSMEFGPLADSAPKSLTDAMNRPDSNLWWEALCAEIKAVIDNNTWTLVELPPGKHAIPLKWVFKVKRDAKGNFEKYKARIVVKSYSQVAGLDFNETFAPVVRVESVRILFAIAAANDLYILHIDCKNTFLHGQSDVEIYVFQPEGFVDPHFPKRVLRLNKSLYGLKQASRIWYLFLCSIIIELGFITLETDPCIYIRPWQSSDCSIRR